MLEVVFSQAALVLSLNGSVNAVRLLKCEGEKMAIKLMYSYYKKESTDDNEITFKNTGINTLSKLCLKSVPYQCFQSVTDRLH